MDMTGYHAVKQSAALFDCSDRGKLEVSSPDAPTFLSNLSTNDVANLPLGGGCLTYFLNAKAKTLFQVLVYHVLIEGGKHAFALDVTPGYAEKLLQHLDRHLISEQVELTDRTAQLAQWHLAGPESRTLIQRAFGQPIPQLDEFQHMERTLGGDLVCAIRRHDPLGVLGFDILCPANRSEELRRAIEMTGVVSADPISYEIRRIEAGTPVYGIDIDENRFVMEVGGANRAVCYTKGCFIGQEPIVMARDRAGFINRAFLPMAVLEGGPIPNGTKLFRGSDEVGVITSSVVSPDRGTIALGYVRRGHQDPGTILDAHTPEGSRRVEMSRN